MRTHLCPGCRSVDVSDNILACSACWAALPLPVRKEVSASARYPLLSQRRRDAIEAAVSAWKAAGIRPS